MTRAGVLLALLVGVSLLNAQAADDSPLTVQRIVVPPERVAKELDKVQQGTLLVMPRQQFEDRVERALAASKTREQKPRLTRAHYSAELSERALTGSGQWTIRHSDGSFAILPADPLNLALAKVKWEQGQDAILAECDGKSLGLVVQHKGNATCLFDWSARGIPTTDGIAFNLSVPPCPITTFELKLPAEYWLASKSDVLATGPHETESPRKHLWKLQATGAKPIEFLIRKVTGASAGAPTIFARVHSVQKIKPERVEIDHDFQIDVPQGSIRQVILEGDAGLKPFGVVLGGSALNNWKWEIVAAKKDAKGGTTPPAGILTIPFPQPVQGKLPTLRVRSFAAHPGNGSWTSPGLNVRAAVSRGETLEAHLHPDVPVGKWDSGSFQPTHVSTELDGTQVLTLADTGDLPRRPTMMPPGKRVDVYVAEDYVWEISPRGMTLSAEVQFSLAAGNLFELRVKLPTSIPAYQIEALDLQPADMLGGWHPDGAGLVVELKKPLIPGKKATLKIRMRSGIRDFTTAIRNVGFPNFEPDLPLSASRREGRITVHVDPVFRAQVVAPMPPLANAVVDPAKPTPSFHIAYRDQRPNVVVRLMPQPVQVQMRGTHTIALVDQDAMLQFRWEVQPLVGSAEFLDFRLDAGFPSTWTLKADERRLPIHRWERLPLQEALPHLLQLGSARGVPSAALETMLPTGTYWRFYLGEPLDRKAHFTLEARTRAGMIEDEWRRLALQMPTAQPWELVGGALTAQALPKSPDGKLWTVPLMTPVQRSGVEQQIVVDSPGEPISKLMADGGFVRNAEKTPTQALLHQIVGNGEPAHHLRLWTRPEKRAVSQLERCDEAQLIAYVHKDGRTYYRVQFRLWHWRDRTCALRLPLEFQVVALKVHDRWLDGLDVLASGSETRLTLPFDQNTDFVRYEIVGRWQPDEAPWPGVRKVRIPRIDWPLAPSDVRTRCFLEDGVVPLFDDALIPVGVPARLARQSATPRWLRQTWKWGQEWLPFADRHEFADKLQEQKQTVLLAEAHMRGELAKPMKFAEALERFALHHLKAGVPLVIDQVAFRAVGLTAEMTVSASDRPFWETLGLIYVPCPSGALLTTAARMQDLGVTTTAQVFELDDALREAIVHGRDASGGFFLIVAWLKLPPTEAHGFLPTPAVSGSDRPADVPLMTEWELRPGTAATTDVVVVEPRAARLVGWLLAALAGFVLWRLQRSRDPLARFRAYVILLALTVPCGFWSPTRVAEFFVLPILLVEIGGFAWCVGRLVGRDGVRSSMPSTITQAKTASATLGILVLAFAWNASAQPPAARAYTVLLIDGAKPTVLVPPDLLAHLDRLENKALPGAVLVSAKYTGKAEAGLVKFEAELDAHSFQDKASLVLPFAGVQLSEGVFLDGAPVLPAPHKNGYALPIVGKGAHHLRLSFSVRVIESDNHEINFTIPKVAQNEIAVQWQPAVQGVHCERSCGEEKTLTDAGRNLTQWHAQIGYEKKVHLRWNGTSTKAIGKAIEVKEAHYWDLRPGSVTLLSSLNYAIGKGSLTRLDIALPAGLHVRRVEALPAAGLPANAAPVIKQWQVSPEAEEQRLAVEFVNPVGGQMTLNLEIVPRLPGQKSNFVLALPAPLQGESQAGWLGYRIDAVETNRKAQNLVAVLPVNADEFDQQWKKQNAPVRPEAAPVSRAVRFQRKSSKAWLELITQPIARHAVGRLDWSLDGQYADLRGKFTITSPQEDMVLVEFFVDKAMTLADVGGPDVARWHLQDSLLQIWLRQPRKETTVQMSGWRSTPFKGVPAAKRSFAVPVIYPLHAQLSGVTLELRTAEDLRATAERLVRVHPTTPGKLLYTIDGPAYEASFQVTPMLRAVAASRLTKVTATEHGMEIWEGVRVTTQRGQLPTLTLHLKDWPHDAPVLEAPGAIVSPLSETKGKTLKHPAWTLKYPSGLPQEVVITLRARTTKEKQTVGLPDLEVEGVVGRHWVVWQDVEMQTDGGKKLISQKPAKKGVASYQSDGWPGPTPAWNHAAFERGLKATLPSTSARTSVRVMASTQTTHMANGPRWLHEATFWISAPEATELRFRFPGPADGVGAWLDGSARAGHTAVDGAEFVLPLAGSPQPRLVELRWHGSDAESMEAPNIASVHIEQAPLPAHQHVVWAPSGMTPPRADPMPALAARLLHEARTQMQITAQLAQDPERSPEISQQIHAAQKQFFAYLRHADYAVAVLGGQRFEISPGPWRDRWTALKNQNAWLAKENHFDGEQKAAEKYRLDGPAPEFAEGVPTMGLCIVLAPNTVRLSLQSEHAVIDAARWSNTQMLLIAAILLFVVSFIKQAWSFVRVFAPEIGLGLTIAAMSVFGVGVAGVVVVWLMLLTRLLWTVGRFRVTSGPAPTQPKPPSNLQAPPATAS